MKTWIKVSVTAYFTSPEGKIERSLSFDVEVDSETKQPTVDTTDVMRKYFEAAAMLNKDDFPFNGMRLMDLEELQAYRAEEEAALDDEIGAYEEEE
jgi:hypothetical protein